MPQRRVDQFRQVVEALDGAPRILITQVDPDAIGAAIGLSLAVRRLQPELEPSIWVAGAVGHPQNRALIAHFELASILRPMDGWAESSGPVMLVDSSLSQDRRLPPGPPLAPVVVIDHHQGSDIPEAEGRFLWLDSVGATCTMLVELLAGLDVDFSAHPQLALLLALGIYTDTRQLVAAGHRDRSAWDRMAGFADSRALQRLIDYPLPRSHYRNLATALQAMEERDGRLVAGLGVLPAAEGDDLSTCADLFLRQEGVQLVVVWGIVGESIRISARSGPEVELGAFLRERFGDAAGARVSPDGTGQGGALVRLAVRPFLDEGARSRLEELVGERIQELIFRGAGEST